MVGDVRDQLGHEQDDDIEEHDLDEALAVLVAARDWIDADAQRAHGDADRETEILDRRYAARRAFTEWLRAFVMAQVKREVRYAIETAMNNHKRQEWHR